MNAVKLKQRIDELEAQREREYEAWLSDEQFRRMLEGIRDRPELTPEEGAEIDRFIRGEA